jgi:hypothetical protein
MFKNSSMLIKNSIEGKNIDSCWLTGYQPLLTKKSIDQLSTNCLKIRKVACVAGTH